MGTLAVPTAAPAQAPTTRRLTLDAVQTTVMTDEGGHHVDGHGGPGATEFGTSGTVWPDPDLTFGFVNHTADLSIAAQQSAVATALATWASVAPFTFTLVPDCGLAFNAAGCTTPDIRISFGSGDHGAGPDDLDFDGPGGTAAHAYFPPPNGWSAAGDVHLDDAEPWSTSGSGVDLESVVLHELGHALGLTHATAAQCPLQASSTRPIMCGTLVGVDRTLAQDDINGIQSLYGPPAVACAGRAITVDLSRGQVPTGGADVILGTPATEVINGGGGADTVCGGGGNDTIDGGGGADRIVGGG
ncbi:MAG TPA: matrixin family metalloprotease, partial [Acidimicrobiales bacterium]